MKEKFHTENQWNFKYPRKKMNHILRIRILILKNQQTISETGDPEEEGIKANIYFQDEKF